MVGYTRFLIALIISIVFAQTSCSPTLTTHQVPVLVIGGGTGGTAAGLQAARMGTQVLIVEPTPWLGGMLTAAGVSATDGNHQLPSGIWGEFRQQVWDHYGGPDSVATGWVSNTQFEPSTGAAIFQKLTKKEKNLDVWHQAEWQEIKKVDEQWKVLVKRNGKLIEITANIVIDGTDLGDVAAAARAEYYLGMDKNSETGEEMAPSESNDILQDLTYVAILKDYGTGADKTIAQPKGYDPAEFNCACQHNCSDPNVVDCEMMLNYGKLPNGKYMINWPNYGNDYYLNLIGKSKKERSELLEEAKAQTLRFVYYIQNELGFKHLGLADDEFPTADQLALIPYHREGRRIKGKTFLTVHHILTPYDLSDPLYRTGIAVGDYPIDHHHDKYPDAPDIEFPPVPSFNIPMGCLLPHKIENFLIADKAISVSNIANGSTRLQPVILQLGQAAGCIASLAIQNDQETSYVNVREVQEILLKEDVFLSPFLDVQPDHPHFEAVQRIGATGILRGTGIPYKWVNQTWFYPDSIITAKELNQNLSDYYPGIEMKLEKQLSVRAAINWIAAITEKNESGLILQVTNSWKDHWELDNFSPDRSITRLELAVLIDRLLDPFHQYPVDLQGNIIGK